VRRCRYTKQPAVCVDDADSRLHALWVSLTAITTVDPVDAVLADDQLLDRVAAAGSGNPTRPWPGAASLSLGCRAARSGLAGNRYGK